MKCGCFKKGSINLTVGTERNYYCYGDTITAVVWVNNKLSKAGVEAVEFTWHKKFNAKASDNSIHKRILHNYTRDLKTWQKIRLDVGAGTESQTNFDLELELEDDKYQ